MARNAEFFQISQTAENAISFKKAEVAKFAENANIFEIVETVALAQSADTVANGHIA